MASRTPLVWCADLVPSILPCEPLSVAVPSEDTTFPHANDLWNADTGSLSLAGASNEVLAFQLAVEKKAITEDERERVAHSLDWRVGHILNEFSWRRKGKINPGGIAGRVGSHQYENVMWTLPGALACYETSAAAREFCVNRILVLWPRQHA